MNVGQVIQFHKERFFEGAVQLSWVQRRKDQARLAAEAFVFHGPRYHGAGGAEQEGIEGNYKLKDTASFVCDLLGSMHAGDEGHDVNPYWLAVAGYGSGKSHLALTCATLLSDPKSDTSQVILEKIAQSDPKIGKKVVDYISEMDKPVLVLPLDGMNGFHLGNALSRAVFGQLHQHGVDASAIRDLSPRFQTAEQFVERNFSVRSDSFSEKLPDLDAEHICERLRENDETVYAVVDALYIEANGHPIPVEGQESAQELIETLCDHYCGSGGAFSHVLILFDELGRYLEYASDKPQLAGDFALQQIFQGVQDNSAKVRFVGFIQYELKAYLKRFSGADLRQLQRYVTRFDTAEKWYLSTNLETIFAHMIGKDENSLQEIWKQADAERGIQQTWQRLSQCLPSFSRYPVWSDPENFSRIIAFGCWPLHPFAVWFLTRQRDLVQSRSALTFIKDVIDSIADEDILVKGHLRQVSAAELVIRNMLPELISAEHETGGTIAETLQMQLEKFSGHLDTQQQMVLAGIAVVEKTRIGKQPREMADAMLCEATAMETSSLPSILEMLSEIGAVEWNDDLGQYELLSDGATRGQFQQWLRAQQNNVKADGIKDLFVRRGVADIGLGDITPDFAQSHDISTPDWFFEAQLAHVNSIENTIKNTFKEWQKAVLPKDAKGKIIYLYLHPEDDPVLVGERIQAVMSNELKRVKQKQAPIWVIRITDRKGVLAEHIGRLHIFDELVPPSDQERFRRFIPDERVRSYTALKTGVQEAIKERDFWIAGFSEIPTGRLRSVALHIFNNIYPKTVPFPFDGFGSAAGGGPADVAQLARGLIARQVNIPWVQSQPKRLQNRTNTVLIQSWNALLRSGELVAPSKPGVSELYQWLEQAHREDPHRTLLASYQTLIAPPYGFNASSAALMLGLLLGIDSPPRRIEQAGDLIVSSEWIQQSFPSQRGRHHFNEDVLATTCLRFLAEDAESRWRSLLNNWEVEKNYSLIIKFAKEAKQMMLEDPLPENLEGNYKYLRDKSKTAGANILTLEKQINDWERGIEKAEKRSSVEYAIRIGGQVLHKQKNMEESSHWSENYIKECESLYTLVHGIISTEINSWIPRQICQTAAQVSDFRNRIEKETETLYKLGFRKESELLLKQAQSSINRVEKLQEFSLTLAQCNDYPRQPEPTDSVSVRTLRDEISLGNGLKKGVEGATAALSQSEIDAHVSAINKRQEKLQAALKKQQDILGVMYSLTFETKEDVREALTKVNRLRDIFVGTPDESEINDLVVQLERTLSDISAWETGNVSMEHLEEILTSQIKHQLATLQDYFEEKEIESAWDMEKIYHALMSEEIASISRRSKEWVQPRLELVKKISAFDRQRCEDLEKELSSAPTFLSVRDVKDVKELQQLLQMRIAELDESERNKIVVTWQERYLKLAKIEDLDKHTTEELLQGLQSPPCKLRSEENDLIEPIINQLTAHLDKISIDELISRIERLTAIQQRQIMKLLSDILKE